MKTSNIRLTVARKYEICDQKSIDDGNTYLKETFKIKQSAGFNYKSKINRDAC